MPKVSATSTRYFTSRKKRLIADIKMQSPVVSKRSRIISKGTHNKCTLNPVPATANTIAKTNEAIKKSKSCESIDAIGSMVLGKNILVTRFLFEMRLCVENLIDETNKDHGIALTETDATSAIVNGLPDSLEKVNLTNIPAVTIRIGIKMAHKKPIIVCLYFMRISRQVSIYNKSRYLIKSVNAFFISCQELSVLS
jgi:hypothetical protein